MHGGQILAPVHDPWREALKSPTRGQWEEIQKARVVSLGTPSQWLAVPALPGPKLAFSRPTPQVSGKMLK